MFLLEQNKEDSGRALCVCGFRSPTLGAQLTKLGTAPLGRIPTLCRPVLTVPWSLSCFPLPDVCCGGPELQRVPGDALCPVACPTFSVTPRAPV